VSKTGMASPQHHIESTHGRGETTEGRWQTQETRRRGKYSGIKHKKPEDLETNI